MDTQQLDGFMQNLDRLTDFSKGTFEPNPDFDEIDFDKKGFDQRWPTYELISSENKLTIFEAAKKIGIEYDDFLMEIHLYAALNPGKVSIRYLSGFFRSGLTKQKEIDAVCYMKENNKSLSIDYICDRLNVSEQIGKDIVKQHKIDINISPTQKKKAYVTYIEIVNNHSLQRPIIKYFNENPKASFKQCIKDLKLNTSESALRNSIENLIERGYKIPCKLYGDPMLEEKEMADIVAYKEKNPYATPHMVARKFDTTETKIITILDAAAEQYRIEKVRSYEFYFKRVLDEIDEVGDLCMERFEASPNTSSRWLEIRQMGLEKKIKMLGLNAPAELHVKQDVNVTSKEERDAILDAFLATDMIDVTPEGL